MIKWLLTVAAALFFLVEQSLALYAAQIQRVATVNCDIELSGGIERGDADKLRSLLFIKDASNNDAEDAWMREEDSPKARFHQGANQVQLCLRSKGGNFAEAVKLIKLILDYSSSASFSGLMTVIEANQQCLSACALVFLAGRRNVGDGETEIMRFMHPTAKLGFHGPFNESEAETKDPQLLERAQRNGVNAVADLLDLDDELFPRTLLQTFLRIPGNEFFYASTVDHLGKWNIGLFDYQKPTISEMGQFKQLCDNTYEWKSSRVVWRNSAKLQTFNVDNETVEDGRNTINKRATFAKGTTWLTLGEYGSETNERCSVQVYRGKRYDYVLASIHSVSDDPTTSLSQRFDDDIFSDPDESGTPAWQFYPSDTKLTALQTATKVSRLFSAFSDPKPDDSPGGFILNDLRVKIAISEGSWSVTLDSADNKTNADDRTSTDKRRIAEIRRVGLKVGTVLFQGVQVGDTVRGTAYAFSPTCPPTPFTVSGKISNNRRFEFKGAAVKLQSNCGAPIQSNGHLEFVFEPDRQMW